MPKKARAKKEILHPSIVRAKAAGQPAPNWQVNLMRGVTKKLSWLNESIWDGVRQLRIDLQDDGPYQRDWGGFRELAAPGAKQTGERRFSCRLSGKGRKPRPFRAGI